MYVHSGIVGAPAQDRKGYLICMHGALLDNIDY